MNHAYPIFLDVADRQIVIIGGGAVASRKAAGLLAAGANRVKAIALQFVKDFPAGIEKISRPFEPKDLDGGVSTIPKEPRTEGTPAVSGWLVFAATDSLQVNHAVVAAARERGIWVCRADGDEDEPGDFIVPALARLGSITVAVSAAGSPAIAAAIRDELAGVVSDDWVKLASAMKQIRPGVIALGLPIGRRREILALASAEAARVMGEGGIEELWGWVRIRFGELPESLPPVEKRI